MGKDGWRVKGHLLHTHGHATGKSKKEPSLRDLVHADVRVFATEKYIIGLVSDAVLFKNTVLLLVMTTLLANSAVFVFSLNKIILGINGMENREVERTRPNLTRFLLSSLTLERKCV